MSSKIDPQARLPLALFQNVLIFAGNLPFAARVSKSWSRLAKNPETERLFYRALFEAYMCTPSLNLYARRSLIFWKQGDQAYLLIDRTIQLIWRVVNQLDKGILPGVRMPRSLDPLSPARLAWFARHNECDTCESSILFFERLAIQLPAARKRQVTLVGKPLQKAIDIRTWCEENRALLAKMKQLDLSELGLTCLPAEICFFSNLEKLDLSNNYLVSLPPELGFLTKLRSLQLKNNALFKLPKELGLLQRLQRLNVSYNMLSCLPAETLQLKELLHLRLEGNCFVSFPREVCGLSALTFLNLSMNQMVEISESIGNLHQLTHLYLNDNRIHYLPATLAKLSALTRLDVRSNAEGCFAAPELLSSSSPIIQNALLAAELHDSAPVVSFFSTAFFRGLLSLGD